MLADRLEELGAGLPDLEAMSEAEVADLLRVLDAQCRAVEARLVAVVEHVEATGLHHERGHRSVSGWLQATANWSEADAVHRMRTARLVHAVPEVADAVAAGSIGVAQVRQMAVVHANPRTADRFAAAAHIFLQAESEVEFADFRLLLNRWQQLADQDGAARRDLVRWRNRHASVTAVDGQVYVNAVLAGLPGGVFATVFDKLYQAELDADWNDVRARYGPDAPADLITRTPAQRRADVLVAMAIQAVSVPADAVAPEPLVHLVVDAATVDEALTGDVADVVDPRERACETRDGHVVPPGDVLTAMWHGQIRALIVDKAGSTIRYGRSKRLFTGPARDAVLLKARRCVWPGCRMPAGRCQADHLDEHHHGGPTDVDNGAPLCRYHNRFKHRTRARITYRNGTWHTHLPQPDADAA